MTGLDRARLRASILCCLIALAGQLYAQAPTPDPKAEIQAAFAEANSAGLRGPQSVALKNQGVMALPKGFVFIPAQPAQRLLKALGNTSGPTLVGMIMPMDKDAEWMAVLRYIDAGYIKDDDAKNLECRRAAQESQGRHQRAELGAPFARLL